MMTGWRACHKLPVMLVSNRGNWFKRLPALEDRLDSEVWHPSAPWRGFRRGIRVPQGPAQSGGRRWQPLFSKSQSRSARRSVLGSSVPGQRS